MREDIWKEAGARMENGEPVNQINDSGDIVPGTTPEDILKESRPGMRTLNQVDDGLTIARAHWMNKRYSKHTRDYAKKIIDQLLDERAIVMKSKK